MWNWKRSALHFSASRVTQRPRVINLLGRLFCSSLVTLFQCWLFTFLFQRLFLLLLPLLVLVLIFCLVFIQGLVRSWFEPEMGATTLNWSCFDWCWPTGALDTGAGIRPAGSRHVASVSHWMFGKSGGDFWRVQPAKKREKTTKKKSTILGFAVSAYISSILAHIYQHGLLNGLLMLNVYQMSIIEEMSSSAHDEDL